MTVVRTQKEKISIIIQLLQRHRAYSHRYVISGMRTEETGFIFIRYLLHFLYGFLTGKIFLIVLRLLTINAIHDLFFKTYSENDKDSLYAQDGSWKWCLCYA